MILTVMAEIVRRTNLCETVGYFDVNIEEKALVPTSGWGTGRNST